LAAVVTFGEDVQNIEESFSQKSLEWLCLKPVAQVSNLVCLNLPLVCWFALNKKEVVSLPRLQAGKGRRAHVRSNLGLVKARPYGSLNRARLCPKLEPLPERRVTTPARICKNESEQP
jgi:hypothetical protein